MQAAPTVTPTPPGPAQSGLPVGTSRKSIYYFDAAGRRHRSRVPVPVDQYGRISGVGFRCRKCREPYWYPANVKDAPVCPTHNRRMEPLRLRRPPLLPYREIWKSVSSPLRPVWALAAVGAAGVAVDVGNVPALAAAGAAPLAFEVGRRAWRSRMRRWHTRRGNLDADDPQAKKRLREAVDRAARNVGYSTAAAAAWLALPAGLGADPDTAGGAVTWTALPALWLPAAATYWWKRRQVRPVAVQPDLDFPQEPGVDRDEQYARQIWDNVLAVRQGQTIRHAADGVTPVKAERAGRLAGTRLEDWHRVEGGWAATIVGPIGAYESEQFVKAVGAIASAFSVKKSMVTVIPDPEDENRSLVMIQRVSPIKETPRWAGPESIDVQRGVAPVMRYADGEWCMYELWRRGWGCPHVAAFGTTGVAKSSFLKLLFTIDRWAHHEGRGLVADFLVDPQQGQSFAEFLDDLAAPPACEFDEALLLVEALHREALRRNRYLAREAKWWDERRKKWRTGREWWDPLVDGPILALTVDEAHDYLSYKPFASLVTKAGRMWRKCGLQLRIATHTPLLSDLGGSMALRDMLTGGFVWMGRTANSLSGPVAFNGRLPVDPRLIPALPGMAYPLAGLNPKPMLARTMREPDWYDWLRDESDERIGYPAVLPPETLKAFGPWFEQWVKGSDGSEFWTPETTRTAEVQRDSVVQAAVLDVLRGWNQSLMDMNQLDDALRLAGVEVGTLAIRQALKDLRAQELVASTGGQHALTELGRQFVAEALVEAAA